MFKYPKVILGISFLLVLFSMTTLKFEVVTPGKGIIVGSSGDIDVVTPDSGFINFVNVKVGDEIEKDEIIFSYNNLDVFHRHESLQNIIEFLENKKELLEWDLKNLNDLYQSAIKSEVVNKEVNSSKLGSNTARFLRELNSLNRKDQELKLIEEMNLAERKELDAQSRLLNANLTLLENSSSPKIEILDKKREIAQLRVSKIKLESELLTKKAEIRNDVDEYQIKLLEKINILSEEVNQIKKELIESSDSLQLALGKQKANVIHSPVSGTILNIEKNFTVGSYIESSQKVLTIKQYQSNSLIESRIEAKYRPFIFIGSDVKIVVNSPGYKKNLTGVIKSISVDSFLDENNPQSQERYYKVEIEPKKIEEFSNTMIGVQVDVFVISDNITALDYITATVVESVFFNVW